MYPAHHSSGIITTTVEVARVRNFEGEVFKSNRKGKRFCSGFNASYAHTVMRALCVRRDIEQVPQRSRCLETLRGMHARPHKKHPAQKQT